MPERTGPGVLLFASILSKVLAQNSSGSTPLFVTFDSHISPSSISKVPFLSQEVFVWGATASHVPAWRDASKETKLSYYMPYSRAPAARLGFDLSFWKAEHPDWILYRCDRKTVAFWGGESGNTGSVPLDFTNPAVIEWQVKNQSVYAQTLGYDAMAFDNFGGGARQGANVGQACGIIDNTGTWQYRFNQSGPIYKATPASVAAFQEASVRWIESVHSLMQTLTPGLGIVPNVCVDNRGWVHSSDAQRVAASITGALSERGFTGWGSGRIKEQELLDEYLWMEQLATAGKSYYSINEVKIGEWSETWVQWVLAAFAIGQQPGSALWLGHIQGYGNWSYWPALAVDLGIPTSPRFGSPVLWRNFSHGIAVLNPTEDPVTVNVGKGKGGKGYVGLFGGLVHGGQIRIVGQDARILLYRK